MYKIYKKKNISLRSKTTYLKGVGARAEEALPTYYKGKKPTLLSSGDRIISFQR